MAEERRKSVLTEFDFEKIGETFERKQAQLFETIGYDVSSHESRSEIRKDHDFVRSARSWKTWLVVTVAGTLATATIAAVVGG